MTAKIHDAELKAIVKKHAKWLRGEYGGEYANLRDANLSDADLRYAKNIDKIKWNMYTAFYPLQCPEARSLGIKRLSAILSS